MNPGQRQIRAVAEAEQARGKINLTYPKIQGSRDAPLKRCVAFEKYDGTNLHWLWLRDLGWAAFGTRRDQFALDERGIAEFRA